MKNLLYYSVGEDVPITTVMILTGHSDVGTLKKCNVPEVDALKKDVVNF